MSRPPVSNVTPLPAARWRRQRGQDADADAGGAGSHRRGSPWARRRRPRCARATRLVNDDIKRVPLLRRSTRPRRGRAPRSILFHAAAPHVPRHTTGTAVERRRRACSSSGRSGSTGRKRRPRALRRAGEARRVARQCTPALEFKAAAAARARAARRHAPRELRKLGRQQRPPLLFGEAEAHDHAPFSYSIEVASAAVDGRGPCGRARGRGPRVS